MYSLQQRGGEYTWKQTLSFIIHGDVTVEVAGYRVAAPDVEDVPLLSRTGTLPNGTNDLVGTLTLKVYVGGATTASGSALPAWLTVWPPFLGSSSKRRSTESMRLAMMRRNPDRSLAAKHLLPQ